jgi:hypothetical protein
MRTVLQETLVEEMLRMLTPQEVKHIGSKAESAAAWEHFASYFDKELLNTTAFDFAVSSYGWQFVQFEWIDVQINECRVLPAGVSTHGTILYMIPELTAVFLALDDDEFS